MYVYQADKISEFEEEKARILRDIITSKVQQNYTAIQDYYGLVDEAPADSILRGRAPRRDPDNPYLVERRKAKSQDVPRARRKSDGASPLRGKY